MGKSRPNTPKPTSRHYEPRFISRPHAPQLYLGAWLPRLQEAERAPRRIGFTYDAIPAPRAEEDWG